MVESKNEIDNEDQVKHTVETELMFVLDKEEVRHIDDISDIIANVPSWLGQWNLILVFAFLVLTLGFSVLMKYPDLIRTQIKIESSNSSKPVVSKVSGRLVKLLVRENMVVVKGQPLAYIGRTGNHSGIPIFVSQLKKVRNQVNGIEPVNLLCFPLANDIQLGKLQSTYSKAYREYLNYQSVANGVINLEREESLKEYLLVLIQQIKQLNQQKRMLKDELVISGNGAEIRNKIAGRRADSLTQIELGEWRYLAQDSFLTQAELALMNKSDDYLSKQKEEEDELHEQLKIEKGRFLLALNDLINQAENWEGWCVLSAPQSGRLFYDNIIKENQKIDIGQEVFYIEPDAHSFWGKVAIPRSDEDEIRKDQEVLIKLKSYPFKEYRKIRGRISYLANTAYKGDMSILKVLFKIENRETTMHLTQGMIVDAEIVTDDATVLQRFNEWFLKVMEK